MTISVDFKLAVSDGARARVKLRDGTNPPIVLNFNADGKATAQVQPGTDYSAPWVLVGAKNNTIKVTWTYDGVTGLLIDSKIRTGSASPWPGGPWMDDDVGYLPALQEVADA